MLRIIVVIEFVLIVFQNVKFVLSFVNYFYFFCVKINSNLKQIFTEYRISEHEKIASIIKLLNNFLALEETY